MNYKITILLYCSMFFVLDIFGQVELIDINVSLVHAVDSTNCEKGIYNNSKGDLEYLGPVMFKGELKQGLAFLWQMDTNDLIIVNQPNDISIDFSFSNPGSFQTDIIQLITNSLAERLQFVIRDSISDINETVYLVKIFDQEKMIRSYDIMYPSSKRIKSLRSKLIFDAFWRYPYWYFPDMLRNIETINGFDFPIRLEQPNFSGVYDFFIPVGNISKNLEVLPYNSYLDMNEFLKKMGIEIQLVTRKVPIKIIEFIGKKYVEPRKEKRIPW